MIARLSAIVGLGLAFVVVEMAATWFASRRLRNYGIVDAVWALGFAPLAILAVMVGNAAGTALTNRALVLASMATLWALRLGVHLGVRVRAHHPHEDVRYATLRADWGANADRRMLGFFLLQGGLQVALALPFVWVAVGDATPGPWFGLGVAELGGIALWAVGIIGESVADAQLARFRANPSNRGGICRVGLWNHSRHPNYFFEWLVWVGYAVYASGSPWGWLAWASPALMYHFLVNVTGVPMTEELSVRSRGDAYREYQRTTNAFFPGPARGSIEGSGRA